MTCPPPHTYSDHRKQTGWNTNNSVPCISSASETWIHGWGEKCKEKAERHLWVCSASSRLPSLDSCVVFNRWYFTYWIIPLSNRVQGSPWQWWYHWLLWSQFLCGMMAGTQWLLNKYLHCCFLKMMLWGWVGLKYLSNDNCKISIRWGPEIPRQLLLT